ncbi:uncharacterized protein CLUP02_18403 [Colletotrichum lupini]|uniref:Uncharacterized protein n=1 Tax=Colletotrichum lupini TaxID=145971 RepID=A0A9Q8SGX6_9PEZI|nr:uncharacterized protein CLUP02_18403 [Colletotrichum lupini]UQC76888.1 hypothetical protein CLUP02_18403 [Colletotrichum lupini]
MAVNWVWRARQLQRFAAQDPPHEYANCITKAHLRRAKLLAPDPTEMDPDEPMWPEKWGLLPQSLPSFLTRGEWVSLPEYPADGEEGEEEEVPMPKEVSKDPKEALKDPKESGKKAAAAITTKPIANSTTKPKTQSTPQSTTQPPMRPPTKPPMEPRTRPKTRPMQPSTERSGLNKPQAKHDEPRLSTRTQVQAEGQVQVQGHRQTIAQEPGCPLLPSLLPSILPYSPLLSPSPATTAPPPPPPPPTSVTPSTSLPLGIRVSGAWPEGEESREANIDTASSSRDREQPKYLVIEEDQEQPPPGTRGFTWDEMKECLEYLKHERRKR